MSRKRLIPDIKKGAVNIIDAVPGAGKTTTLVHNIVRVVRQRHVGVSEVLALTFNRAMAEELQARCAEQGLDVGATTLHAFGFALIKADPRRFGLANGIRVLNNEHRYLGAEYTKVFGKQGPISLRLLKRAVDTRFNHGTRVRRFLEAEDVNGPEINEVLIFLDQYSRAKKEQNKLGFHDMISLPLRAMKKDPEYLRQVCDQYQLLAVDEYQDLNAQERELTLLLAKHIPTVLIVGDDLQAIHGYRGAKVDAVHELKAEFEDTHLIKLNHSYRLNQQHARFLTEVAFHNGHDIIIEGTGNGPAPQFVGANSRDQMYRKARKIIEELTDNDVDASDIAVLARYRTSVQTFGRYLEDADIPIAGADDQQYKLLLRFRRFLRAVVGEPEHLATLLCKAADIDQEAADQLTDLDNRIPATKLGLTEDQHKVVRKFRNAVQDVLDAPRIDRVLNVFAREFQGKPDRYNTHPIQHVLRVQQIPYDHQTTPKRLLKQVTRRIKALKAGVSEGVTLSTIHSAKGREWKHVVVLDLYDENLGRHGEFPIDEDAEYRVFHVGLSRATVQVHGLILKHEAAGVRSETYQKGLAAVIDIHSAQKYAYHALRYLPPYPEVKALCQYDRAELIPIHVHKFRIDERDLAGIDVPPISLPETDIIHLPHILLNRR